MCPLSAVILAAGQGKRMKSHVPKVLHVLAGRTLLEFVVDAARDAGAEALHVVYGHGGERVPETLAHLGVNWILQEQQLGTGHAVQQAMPAISDDAVVLVLYGDVPLVDPETLRAVVARAGEESLGLVTVCLPHPAGYGRILRDNGGHVVGIVEEKDADDKQRCIEEINTGIVAVGAARLRRWLNMLDNDNAQGEFYLTDIISLAVREGLRVDTVAPKAPEEVLGVNDRRQLALLERYFQARVAERLMVDGVTLRDPARLDVRGTLVTGQDVTMDVNVIIEGRVVIGNHVTVGPNTYIRDAEIGDHTRIHANCVIEEAQVGGDCQIGPFSRLRPQARLADQVHVGNFVEIKKSDVGAASKVNHLTYVGDSEIGRGVNVGAGTITCNYDGANKHKTVIGDGAFIGSGTELVAPVIVGAGATIGAGSTITADTLPGKLTVERSRQRTVNGWRRPVKIPSK